MPEESWQHRDVITNGIRMHYVTLGDGPLIVLLHGFPEFWYSWRFQLPFLAGLGYTAVAPDLRGYNDTDKPRVGYDVPTLLADIAGLIRQLGYERAIIVGHDWGGALAWSFAMQYPGMTERLVVMNAPHPGAFLREMRTLKQLRKSWYMFVFQLPWLPEYLLLRDRARNVTRLIQEAAVHTEVFPPHVLDRYREAMSKPGAMTAALNYYRQLFRGRPGAFLDGQWQWHISAPTLLIWGEQDIALGIELTKGLEQWVPHLTIRRIADSGHWVQQEQADLVNHFLKDFLLNFP